MRFFGTVRERSERPGTGIDEAVLFIYFVIYHQSWRTGTEEHDLPDEQSTFSRKVHWTFTQNDNRNHDRNHEQPLNRNACECAHALKVPKNAYSQFLLSAEFAKIPSSIWFCVLGGGWCVRIKARWFGGVIWGVIWVVSTHRSHIRSLPHLSDKGMLGFAVRRQIPTSALRPKID